MIIRSMYDNEISRSKNHGAITTHPRIYSSDRTQISCNDLEAYTKGILQYGRHKAIILEYKNQLLGHIKLSGYKTFLRYGTDTPNTAGYVYDTIKGMEERLHKSKEKGTFNFNNQGLAKVILTDNDPLGLRFSRSINREDYRVAVPEHLKYNITIAEQKAINDNFHIDLQFFLEKIKNSKLPIAHIPFKDIHYKKTLFYYLGLQKKLETY